MIDFDMDLDKQNIWLQKWKKEWNKQAKKNYTDYYNNATLQDWKMD